MTNRDIPIYAIVRLYIPVCRYVQLSEMISRSIVHFALALRSIFVWHSLEDTVVLYKVLGDVCSEASVDRTV